MGTEPKPRSYREEDYYDDNIDEILKDHKYLYKPEAKHDLLQVLHNYRDLHPKIERCAHSAGGRTEELITLRGTIPISFKSSTYNIPIQIYTLRTHPKQVPVVFVKPMKNMIIRESKNVDKSGLVYLRYLVDWKSPRSTTLALCKLLSRTFSEECPVFTEDREKAHNAKKAEKNKSRKKRFGTFTRRFSISKKHQCSTEVTITEHSPQGILVEKNYETLESIRNKNIEKKKSNSRREPSSSNAIEALPCDTPSITSDSSDSKKSVSFADSTSDDIPNMTFDDTLDSLYSSSFESLYSERSVTILAALKNQKLDAGSVFNSSFESLLSEKSISYLLDLEKNWQRPGDPKLSPNPSLDSSRSQRTIRPRRPLSANKRDALKRISHMSTDSDHWPTPPLEMNETHNLEKQGSLETWPDPPPPPFDDNKDEVKIDELWPAPPNDDFELPPEYPTLTSTARDRSLSDLPESPLEDIADLHDSPFNNIKKPQMVEGKEYISKETQYESTVPLKEYVTTETQYNTWDKPDKKLLEALREGRTEYLDTLDPNMTPTPERKSLMEDNGYDSDILKLDFTDIEENTSSRETTPRAVVMTEGGMVKRADPPPYHEKTKKRNRWPFRKKGDKSEVKNSETKMNSEHDEEKEKPWSHSNDSNNDNRRGSLTIPNGHDSPSLGRKHVQNRPEKEKRWSHDSNNDNDKRDYSLTIPNGHNSPNIARTIPNGHDSPSLGRKHVHNRPEKEKRWSHDSNNDNDKRDYSLTIPNGHDSPGMARTIPNGHDSPGMVKKHMQNRSRSEPGDFPENESIYERVNMNGHTNHSHENGINGELSNGIYERVNLMNGFKHRDCVCEAKIYEPISVFSAKNRTSSDTALTNTSCIYKSVGCLAHSVSESDSLNHNDEAVNHHMYLLLNKVEHLSNEVQTLRHKVKTLEVE